MQTLPGLLGLLLMSAVSSPAQEIAGERPYTLVAFGDSTTAARGTLVVYPTLLQNELVARNHPIRVINAGVGGNTTQAALARLETDVLAHRPDLVVVQFGINDSAVDVWKKPPATEPRVPRERFAANLRTIVQTLAARRVRVVLMTPNPLRWTPKLRELYNRPPYNLTSQDGMNVLLHDYADAVRQVAREKKTGLVDIFAAFTDQERRDGIAVDQLLLDGMHPNARGHRMIADLVSNEIAIQDDRVTRKPPDPASRR